MKETSFYEVETQSKTKARKNHTNITQKHILPNHPKMVPQPIKSVSSQV